MAGIRAFWWVVGAALVGTSAVECAMSIVRRPSATVLVWVMVVAGGVYLGAVHAAVREARRVSLWYVLAVGLLCRLILIPSQPLFDDDIHRYAWDGKVLVHGVNPYLYAPADDTLAHLRDANWAKIGYPDVKTIYPPTAQVVFAAARLARMCSVPGLKLVFLLFDMGTALLIVRLLRSMRLPEHWVIVYAWSPLAVKEFANSGHLEPVMLFLLVLTLLPATGKHGRCAWTGIAFGAALLVKFVPMLLAPIVLRLGRWRSLAYCAVTVVLLYLPFVGAGGSLFSGARTYARYWEFNDGAFALLSWIEHRMLGGHASSMPVSPARALAALVVMTYAFLAARRVDLSDSISAVRAGRNVIAACLLLMPTVDPWYVCWLLPFLCIAPSRGPLVFTVTCSLSYLYYAGHGFPAWIPILEYVPVYALLIVDLRRSGAHPRASGQGGALEEHYGWVNCSVGSETEERHGT